MKTSSAFAVVTRFFIFRLLRVIFHFVSEDMSGPFLRPSMHGVVVRLLTLALRVESALGFPIYRAVFLALPSKH